MPDNQFPTDVTLLTDEQLDRWFVACNAADELERIDFDDLKGEVATAQAHDFDTRYDFSTKVFEEQQRRHQSQTNSEVGRTLNEASAGGVSDYHSHTPDPMRMLKYRCARVLHLIELNAPDPIIQHALNVLKRTPDVDDFELGKEPQ